MYTATQEMTLYILILNAGYTNCVICSALIIMIIS